jgi:hypothetical protein
MGLRIGKLCPMGHYCLGTTKTTSVSAFANSKNKTWIKDPATGVLYFNKSSHNWDFKTWPLPAVGKSRSLNEPDNYILLAEAPFPCPIGYYCRAGVTTQIPIPKNFSTPQRCFDGYFCPRGSISPEGCNYDIIIIFMILIFLISFLCIYI